MRPWIDAQTPFGGNVTIEQDSITSPRARSFQRSHRPAHANGCWSNMRMSTAASASGRSRSVRRSVRDDEAPAFCERLLKCWPCRERLCFGGTIAFIFADLIVLPILDIYRRYYGLKMSAFLLVTFYIAMSASALIVEFLFDALGLVPAEHRAQIVEASISWNYTTILNILFLALAAFLAWRFVRTGGASMLRMMSRTRCVEEDDVRRNVV
jgi:uncharacterized membrane protein YraQ (UPF0718 family)